MNEQELRRQGTMAALALLRTPYRWGGKNVVADGGLDCSGFAEVVMQAVGIHLPIENADTLWKTLPGLLVGATLQPCDLAFYGDQFGTAHHVALILGPGGTAIIGANGGSPPRPSETAAEYASRMAAVDAGVRIEDWRRGGPHYRPDFLGFRRLPVEKSAYFSTATIAAASTG